MLRRVETYLETVILRSFAAQNPHLADFFRLQCHRVVTPHDFIVASGFKCMPNYLRAMNIKI